MSKNYTQNNSKSDWDALEKLTDEEIDFSDVPEITAAQMARAEKRVAGVPVERGKTRVNIYLDNEIVAYFKEKAGGRGYQTLINESLRQLMYTVDLETKLRTIIREELNVEYRIDQDGDGGKDGD